MKSGPRYGQQSKTYPHEVRLFGGMQQRCHKGYSTTEFGWDEQGFIDFIEEVGAIPEGMPQPSLGRRDHSVGYVKGNIFWQDTYENRVESILSGRARVGKKHSPETIAKMSAAKTGKKMTDETRAKMSASAFAGWNKRRS